VLRELVEPSLPPQAALLDPPAGIIERPPSQLAPPDSALFVCLDQACLLESSDVLQDSWQRDVQGRSQLGEGQRSGPEEVEDLSSMTIGQRGERPVQDQGRRLNHLGKYYPSHAPDARDSVGSVPPDLGRPLEPSTRSEAS
jgi:hypothetical protein